jgi:hypothetical protein
MAGKSLRWSAVWALARRQHGVVARWQLLDLGMTPAAIDHRVAIGRLHRLHHGVYAVGRPSLSREGRWLAAALACGESAVLSDESGGCIWGFRDSETRGIEVTVPAEVYRRRPGIVVHRRTLAPDDVTEHRGLPVTTPQRTIADLASRLPRYELEDAINALDRRDLVDPESLRCWAGERRGRLGVRQLLEVLDRSTFTLTDSELERRFRPIVKAAGLPPPLTQVHVNGFRVDFYWPDLGSVVETDGLRYHRTPAQQARDRVRDQAHVAGGLTPLRFTRAQVHYEESYVAAVLARTARRLGLAAFSSR